MTLYTSDYLEYYLTLVGWIINNGIWNVLVASGVFALPFIAIIMQEWLKARGEGADEGNKGALSAARIETRIWVAIFVILFAGIPVIDVNLSTIQFDNSRSKQCQVNVPKPNDTRWNDAFTTLNGQSAKVPVWWFFVHSVSRAVTASAVASIPCGTDLRQMRMDINATRINDNLLSQEVSDFSRDCYGPSRAKLFISRPDLDNKTLDDIGWIGSHYFVNTAGYYNNFRSQKPRVEWPYNSTRDVGLPEVDNGGGYPNCKQWWSDSGHGLKARLVKQVDPDLLSQFRKWLNVLSQDEVDEKVIRAIASPSQELANIGRTHTDYGGEIGLNGFNMMSRTAGDVGMAVGGLLYFPAMDVMRQALPMVLTLLKMALLICLPLILIVGTYELKHVMTISCIEFALFFVDFWFQLARWLDSTILDALYGWDSPHMNANVFIGLNNSFMDMLFEIVMAAMFIALPVFWVGSLAWVGVRAGNMMDALKSGTSGAVNTTKTGMNMVSKAATAVSKKK